MPRRAFGMRGAMLFWVAITSQLVACSDGVTGGANSQSHWLRRCNIDSECGSLSCLCGLCSTTCEFGSTCRADLGTSAACQPAASATESESCGTASGAVQMCVAECRNNSDCLARGSHLHCSAGICRVASATDPAPTLVDSASAGAADGATAAIDGGTNPAPTDPTPTRELTCESGAPVNLPTGVELMALDVQDWTASRNVLTSIDAQQDARGKPWTLRRKTLADGSTSSVVEQPVSAFEGLTGVGADTALVLLDVSVTGGVNSLRVRLIPEDGMAVNLAIEQGRGEGAPLLDASSVYWMARDAGKLTLWRSPRTPGDSTSLGTLPLADASAAQGLVSIGGWLYGAINTGGAGQLLRASKDGSSQLATFGPALPAVASVASDGSDLWIMLDGTTDRLGNRATPPRIARLLATGTVQDLTPIDTVGSDLAVDTGKIYWRVSDNTGPAWNGALWAVARDGSSAPSKLLSTPGHLLADGLVSDQGKLYFAIYCRVDLGENLVGGRTHVLRLTP